MADTDIGRNGPQDSHFQDTTAKGVTLGRKGRQTLT